MLYICSLNYSKKIKSIHRTQTTTGELVETSKNDIQEGPVRCGAARPLFASGNRCGGGIRRVAQPGVHRPTRPLLPLLHSVTHSSFPS
jgi:hypothetical protein